MLCLSINQIYRSIVPIMTILASSLFVVFPCPAITLEGKGLNIWVDSKRQPESFLQMILPSNPSVNAEFGFDIDVDGDSLIVGAPKAQSGTEGGPGAVYIYVRNGSSWIQQARLDYPDGPGLHGFGETVGISGDTAVVGSRLTTIGSTQSRGAAYVFVRSSGVWTFQQRLSPPLTEPGFGFANSVAIDGDIIVAGAKNFAVNGSETGSGYIFSRLGTVWSMGPKLTDLDGSLPSQFGFGWSVAISGDTVVVGVPFGWVGNPPQGRGVAVVFRYSGGVWVRESRVVALDGVADDRFGIDVAIDGNTLVVGAYGVRPTVPGPITGAAYVFNRANGSWTQQQKLFGPLTRAGLFGISVDVDQNRILVGDRYAGAVSNDLEGAAYEFVESENFWNLQNRYLAVPSGLGSELGRSVAIQGKRLIAGAPGYGQLPDVYRLGAAYYFIESPTPPDLLASLDTGISDSDNITRSRNLSFLVKGISVGGTVELLRNGSVVESKPATESVTTMNDFGLPPDGTFVYTTRQIADGEISSRSDSTTVVIDNTSPLVSINQQTGQPDPTNGPTYGFQLSNSESVVGFEPSDVSLVGSTANVSNAVITVSPTTAIPIQVSVTNVISDGQYIVASIPSGALADAAGNLSLEYPSVDNMITIDNVRPTVTVNQANGQSDPTGTLPLNFTVLFSEPVTQFNQADLSFAGTTASFSNLNISISGSGASYNVAVSGVVSNGHVVRLSVTGGAYDPLFNETFPSTSVDNTITLDNVGPTVMINQSPSQPDPTTTLPIVYSVVFNELVTGFDLADLEFSGFGVDTSDASITVTGSEANYTVSVNNLVSDGGTVRYRVRDAAAIDVFGNNSSVSLSTDNSITLDNVRPSVSVNQAATQSDPTQVLPISFTASFSENISGFTSADVSLAGSTADVSSATITTTPTGSNSYRLSVSNILSSGEVRAAVNANTVVDARGNPNTASTSTDNVVTFVLAGTPTPTPTTTPTGTPTSTPTNTPTATPTATPAGFEGDVAPRPEGDGAVLAGDVVQMRRFAAGLDTINLATNEFQRADSAPRSSFGDGLINAGDVTQARRYAAGLDPLTGAGGPAVAGDAPLRARIGGSLFGVKVEVKIDEQGLLRLEESEDGSMVVVLESATEVSAVSFGLRYDPALGRAVVLAGDLPDGAVVTVNDTVAGELTVLIDSDRPLGKSLRLVSIGFEKNATERSIEFDGAASLSDLFGNDVRVLVGRSVLETTRLESSQ